MKYFLLFSVFFYHFIGLCQEDSTINFSNEKPPKAYSPTIGFGVGTVGFYGDLNDKDYGSPFTANPGYKVFILQPINSFLNLNLSFFSANIRQEERSLQRNVNFETDLRMGSAKIEYNFGNFLPENRTITPFISTGIEVVEFNPKTDLLAFADERYYYWEDGTIRNIQETGDNEDESRIITRDYTYETDIRESGYNEDTDYTERSLAIPVGVGVGLRLNANFNFRLESTMHFTFTDYIDGITPNTKTEFIGDKKGNGRNDFFFFNAATLSYNFQKLESPDYEDNPNKPFDFLASGNTEDFDNDGVIDLVDACPNTPAGISVDSLGCPIDTDGDGVPDYKDKEINSEYPFLTNDEGVEMTDEMIYMSFLRYIDSTDAFAEQIQRDFTGELKLYRKYKVQIAEVDENESPENIGDLLSFPDLQKTDQNGKSVYTVGEYKSLSDANRRVKTLEQQGYDNTSIIKKGETGDLVKISATEMELLAADVNDAKPLPLGPGVVFRVQLGAFRNMPTEKIYKNIPSLFLIQSEGYYKYISGAFTDFESAAKHKIKMVLEGYEGAFVVPYKDGKRVLLRDVGVKPIQSNPLIGK